MFRLLIKLCLFLPLFLGIAIFNHAMFRENQGSLAWINDKVAVIHKTGKPAQVPIEIFGALAYHLQKAAEPQFSPPVVALGSSRSNYLSGKYFNGREFYNCSVNTGRIEDYLDFYAWFAMKKTPPSEYVIECSPFTLPENMRDTEPRFSSALLRLGLDGSYQPLKSQEASSATSVVATSTKWNLKDQAILHFSPTYFQYAVDGVYQSSLVKPLEGDSLTVDEHVVFLDGSREYPARARNKPLEAVRESVRFHIGISMPKPFEQCPEESKRAFENFLDLLRSKGSRVSLFLPSYHPMFYEAAHQHADCLVKFEAYYRSVAQARGIQVLGSYDPAKTGCTEEDLFDFHHPRRSGMDKSFRDYKAP